MTEQRVGIVTGTDDYIRVRESIETPGGSASKIQIFDFASRQLPTTFFSSPNRSNVTSPDSTDLSALSSTVITVGDKSVLVVAADFNTSGAYCIVVPVFYDNNSTPAIIGIGDELVFQATTFRRTSTGNYFAPVKMLDVFGAARIRLAIKTISSGSVNIYGGVL